MGKSWVEGYLALFGLAIVRGLVGWQLELLGPVEVVGGIVVGLEAVAFEWLTA